MDRIRVEFAGMVEAGQEFRTSLDALRDVLSDLDRQLQADLSEWEGAAQKAYQAAFDEWHAAADDMAAGLADLQRVIAHAHGNFRSAHGANLKMWRA